MDILCFTDDLLIYILSFSCNNFNLLLTSKKIYKLSFGNVGRNRRGWLSYKLSIDMYRKALQYSIYLNHSELLNKLLYDISHFTNINWKDLHGDTINTCVLYDRIDLLKILVEKYNIDPSYPRSIYFLKACKTGKTEIVKYLAKNPQIDINVRDVLLCSSLVLAAEYGHMNVVKFLTQQSDLDLYDATEYAIYIAKLNKHFEIVDYLASFISYSP